MKKENNNKNADEFVNFSNLDKDFIEPMDTPMDVFLEDKDESQLNNLIELSSISK